MKMKERAVQKLFVGGAAWSGLLRALTQSSTLLFETSFSQREKNDHQNAISNV